MFPRRILPVGAFEFLGFGSVTMPGFQAVQATADPLGHAAANRACSGVILQATHAGGERLVWAPAKQSIGRLIQEGDGEIEPVEAEPPPHRAYPFLTPARSAARPPPSRMPWSVV